MSTYDEIRDMEPTIDELLAIENEPMPDWAWDELDTDEWII